MSEPTSVQIPLTGSSRRGKKSALQCQRAAAVMALIESAKLNGHDPHAYLKGVRA